MQYRVNIFLNETPGSRFDSLNEGDTLSYAGTLVVEAMSDILGLEAAFMVGNRMAKDANGLEWPSFLRSVSVGDLLAIRPHEGDYEPRGYAVDNVGFLEVHGGRFALTSGGAVSCRGQFAGSLR